MAKRKLTGKRVLITGASSGIGWQIARQLGTQNAKLVVTARRRERLDELCEWVQNNGGECQAVSGDITDPEHRRQLLEACQSEYGGLDILVNNAGTTAMGPFAEASEDRLRTIFEVNFFSLTELTRLALPYLKRGDDPLLVNMSSVLGHRAVPLKVEYCASKFAVHGFSDALAGGMGRRGGASTVGQPQHN